MNEKNSITVRVGDPYPIYRIVNGERVRIPAQDPNRRYGIKAESSDNIYCLEYTDEEEAEADRMAAEWAAGAPEREKKEREDKERQIQFEKSLKYEERIVAFIDILGWKNAILNSSNGDVARSLGRILSQFRDISNHTNILNKMSPNSSEWPGRPRMTHFSDSIVISAENNDYGKHYIEHILAILTSNFIFSKLLLRGGIAVGELYHEEGLVYGPSLIEAYELESQLAKYPRIILSNDLAQKWTIGDSSDGEPWIKLPEMDNLTFFNFLPPFSGRSFFRDSTDLYKARFDKIGELIRDISRNKETTENIFEKYIWLARYHDILCDRYNITYINRIYEESLNLRKTTLANL